MAVSIVLRAGAFLAAGVLAAIALGSAMQEKKADPPAKNPSEGAEYVGMGPCIGCHQRYHETWSDTVHGKLLLSDDLPKEKRTCEACHGPGSLHIEHGDPTKIVRFPKLDTKGTTAICLKCHQNLINSHDFQRTPHAMSKLKCTTCHNLMAEKAPGLLKEKQEDLCFKCHATIRAATNNFSHHPIPEGTMHCYTCHDVHSGKHDYMLRNDVRELCSKCHADRKGPFVYEHSPNQSGFGGDCTTCHNPHGSPNPSMTIMADRGLCMRCHTGMTNHQPEFTCTAPGCHHYIHGSNSSDLFFGP